MKDALALAWELGYAIALPIVAFVLLGKIADQKFHTAPWLLVSGLILSLPVTSVILYRKVRRFL